MLDPRLSPQEQPFLFNEPHKANERESSWDSMNRAFRAQTHQPPGSPHRNHYRSLSPAARSQAIANGQRELMEMVSNMPESCYELSLKDLVEHNRRRDDHDEARNDASSELSLLQRRPSFGPDDAVPALRAAAARPKAAAAGSVGTGHLLKMGFPMSFGPRSRLKKAASTKKKAAPEDGNPKVPANSVGVVDKEWWKKRYGGGCGNGGGGGESDHSDGDLSSSGGHGSRKSTVTTSSSSGSRSSSLSSQGSGRTSRNQRRVTGGCWGFINRRKNRDVES